MLKMKNTVKLLCLAYLATPCATWQYFTAMADWEFQNSEVPQDPFNPCTRPGEARWQILARTFASAHGDGMGGVYRFNYNVPKINVYKKALYTEGPKEIHSEYYFGKCEEVFGYVLFTHVHLDHIEVLGKIIVRGWIKVPRIPTCIILRAKAYPEDLFRSTSYAFQMCVPRISYCHTHHRFLYYYYEWYIPADFIGGMNWDLYFYGPPSAVWY